MSPVLSAVLRPLFLAGVVIVGTPAAGQADWQFAPFLGYTFRGETTLVDLEDATGERHWNIGGAVRVVGDGPVGLEAVLVYTPRFFQRPEEAPIEARVTSSRTVAAMGNVVLTTPRHWTQYGLRPYVSGGAGLLQASANDLQGVFPISVNLVGMNVGGGAVGFLTDRVGLRFDLRYLRKIHGPDEEELEFPITVGFEPIRLRYWTASVGLVVRY